MYAADVGCTFNCSRMGLPLSPSFFLSLPLSFSLSLFPFLFHASFPLLQIFPSHLHPSVQDTLKRIFQEEARDGGRWQKLVLGKWTREGETRVQQPNRVLSLSLFHSLTFPTLSLSLSLHSKEHVSGLSPSLRFPSFSPCILLCYKNRVQNLVGEGLLWVVTTLQQEGIEGGRDRLSSSGWKREQMVQ